jgi:hypothetical protein
MSSFEGIQYDVEGDIDFFKELKNISSSTYTAAEDDAGKHCLITDEELRPDAVTLKCGHSFNYVPLYKEVLFQKCSTLPKNISSRIMALYTKTMNPNIGYTSSSIQNFQNVQTMTYNSSINLETSKLHYDEIKCPYCRDITPKLLPYYPYPEVSQVKYVNSPSGLCLKGVACEYYKKFPAKVKTNNKSTGTDENKTCDTKTCDACPTYNEQYGLLCRTHLKKVSTVKPTAVPKPRKPKSENSIVSHIDPTTLQTEAIYDIDNTKCGFLLLTGLRKGQPCGCNATSSATTQPMCKRHSNK